MKKLIIILFSVILLSVAVQGYASGGRKSDGGKSGPVRLAFGSTNSQSAHYTYFASVAKIVNSMWPEEISATVVETGATVDNLKRMARDQVDMGLVTTSTLYHAYNGAEGFDEPIKSRLLWAYSLAPQMVLVRMDSGVTSIEGLEGIKFGPGQRGSSTEATSLSVMELLGITPDWVRGTNGELAAAIKDERAEGFIKSAVGTSYDALTTEISVFTPIQALGINDEQEAAIRKSMPELSIVNMPGEENQNTGPYTTWGFMIAISAKPNLSDEVAYMLTKAALTDKTEQVAAFPALKGVDIGKLTTDYATTPIHPGAVRAFEELGYTVPENLK